MREFKLMGTLGIILLAIILIAIVRMNEEAARSQAELETKFACLKNEHANLEERLRNLLVRLEKPEGPSRRPEVANATKATKDRKENDQKSAPPELEMKRQRNEAEASKQVGPAKKPAAPTSGETPR